MAEKTEQMREVRNFLKVGGELAELEVRHGKTKKGVDYIGMTGVVQFGEKPLEKLEFNAFAQKTKADGSDSKMYTDMCQWAEKAVSKVKAKEKGLPEYTWFEGYGSIQCQDYVNRDGKLVESYCYNITNFHDFKEYCCDFDLEGYIRSVTDETKGEDKDPTGRKIIRLLSHESRGDKIIDFKNLRVPQELADQLEDNGYVAGATTTLYFTLAPVEAEPKKKSGGIGKQRETQGRDWLEYQMVGAADVISDESEKAISSAVAKVAYQERKAYLDGIEAEGYKGGSSGSSSTPTSGSRSGLGNKSADTESTGKMSAVDEGTPATDDDWPF